MKLKKIAEKADKNIDQIDKKDRFKFKETWWDKTFGPVGPIISSLIGIIVLILAITILRIVCWEIDWIVETTEFIENYIYLLFGMMLLSSYSTYFTHKYYKTFRWYSSLQCNWILFCFLDRYKHSSHYRQIN
ncbi:MAG: hypothetical protein V5A68_02315 [Candidatus Thermoplasmatota archaeon]